MVVSMFQEKRNTVRVRSIHLLTFSTQNTVDGNEDLGMARTLNISEQGILVEAFKEVQVGSKLEILINIAADCITVIGEVVRVKNKNSKWQLAVEFTEMSSEDRDILNSFLDNNFPYTRYSP